MCRLLAIPRILIYYKKKQRLCNTRLENQVIKIFRESKNNYGSRKIKAALYQLCVAMSVDAETLKSFVQNIIERITTDCGKVKQIIFKNGLSHTFVMSIIWDIAFKKDTLL